MLESCILPQSAWIVNPDTKSLKMILCILIISIKCLLLGCILQNENNLERKKITEELNAIRKEIIYEGKSSRREYQYKRSSTESGTATQIKPSRKELYCSQMSVRASTCICHNNDYNFFR